MFASRGSGVRVSLAPPGKTPPAKIDSGPFVAIACSNGLVLAVIKQPV